MKNTKKRIIQSVFVVSLFAVSSFYFISHIPVTNALFTDNVIAHYTFDEGTGTTAGDSAGSNTGTLLNNPTWTAGKVGSGALSFDGTNDRVGSSVSFPSTNSFSYSFWMKTSMTNSGLTMDWQFQRYCSLNYVSAGKITCTANGTVWSGVSSVSTINNDQWHHVVYTVTASSQSIFVDGVQQSSGNITLGTNSGVFSMGSDAPGGANFFTGLLDDVRIYDRALTSIEVGELYALGGETPPPEPDPEDPSDTTNPAITVSPSASSITTTGATITWTTDESATSQVQYGVTSTYTSNSTETSSRQTSHSVILSGLTPGTTYHYRVVSKDAANNSVNSSDLIFTTATQVSAGSGPNWYVDKNAIGANNGSSWTNAWTSFAAIDWTKIQPGHTLYVSGGTTGKTYKELLTVPKSGTIGSLITIKAASDSGHNGTVTIDAEGLRNAAVSTYGKDYVRIEGFEITNALAYGILVASVGGGTGIEIVNNNIHGIKYVPANGLSSAIYYYGARNGLIEGNHLHDNEYDAITVGVIDGMTIRNNNIHDNAADGIKGGGRGTIIIEGNTIHNHGTDLVRGYHGDGIQYMGGADTVIIRNNTFHSNSQSIFIDTWRVNVTEWHKIYIYNNIVYNPDHVINNGLGWYNGISAGAWAGVQGDSIEEIHIYNNTVVDLSTGSGGIATGGPKVGKVYVKNNLFYNSTNNTGTASAVTEMDNNLYFNDNTSWFGSASDRWYFGDGFVNLAGYRAKYSGREQHSLYANPRLDGNFNLGNTSAAINIGTDLSALGIPGLNLDKNGTSRPQGAGWDIGAYEYCTGTCSSVTPPVVSTTNTSQAPTTTTVPAASTVNPVIPRVSTPVSPTTISSPTPSVIQLLTVNLFKGITHPDVKILQTFLNSQGYTITTAGSGSRGQESTMFGPATEAALKRFQCAKAIICSGTPDTTGYGKAGPKTRGTINSLLGGGAGGATSIISPLPPIQQPVTTQFTRNLSQGMTGNDVKTLQGFLNKKGFVVSSTGIGSLGQESTYFGVKTKQALSRYQSARGITPTAGFLGPITRVRIQTEN